MVAKKKAVKKSAKKPAKKVVKKAAKVAKSKVKAPAKRSAKKPAKKAAPKPVAVQPVTDSTGVVTMKSVDDPGQVSEGQAATVKPQLDKETGVLTMVPQE